MKTFARLFSALGLAAVFATSAFAQAPAPMGKHVKGYTKMTKTGKMVQVKGYNRAPKMAAPKMAHVKGYIKMTKTGKMVQVKGYNRKVAPKKMMGKPGSM